MNNNQVKSALHACLLSQVWLLLLIDCIHVYPICKISCHFPCSFIYRGGQTINAFLVVFSLVLCNILFPSHRLHEILSVWRSCLFNHFQNYFSHLAAISVPIYALLKFHVPILCTIFFPSFNSKEEMNPVKTRAFTKCDLIPLPALWQKLLFCTQTDTRMDTHGNTDTWTDRLILVC